MIEIIPSVLAHTRPSFRSRLRVAERLGRRIHVDAMDGKFVTTRSVSLDTLRRQNWTRKVGLHLMVAEPERWIEVALHPMVEEVIIHAEIGARLRYALALMRSNRKQVCLAINPRTPIVKVEPWLRHSHGIHVMTVHPGSNHAAFLPSMLRRIQEIRKRHPRIRITCDGGITPITLPKVLEAGANRVIVGSYVQFADQPEQAWQQLHDARATN
jgi:ribulose-phosphate 3-epimerase